MRLRGETFFERLSRVRQWRRIFAFFPTQTVDGYWVWLERVWCRAVPWDADGVLEEFSVRDPRSDVTPEK